ncbi:MAG: HlyC/CorC family transporter [Sandaracinaceae bacterium]|nr:HlyC/CorC family transporter [Myxococcales bacterium]MCB9661318.1 HlyC/CorC family transporter [Sandaracinaceae bacterium]
MDDPPQTLFALALVTFAGVAFSATSGGLAALGEARLHAIAEEGDARGRAAQDVLARLPQLRTRLVVGRFICIVAMALLALRATQDPQAAVLWLIPAAIVYGVLADVASSITRRRAARMALPLVRFMRPLELLVAPVAVPMVLLRRLTERWVEPAQEENPAQITALAVEHMIDAGEEQGSIEEGHAEMLRSLLDFRDTVTREVMVPRPRVVAFSLTTDMPALLDGVVESGHSRYPVYGDGPDQIEGILYAKDLFQALRGVQDPAELELGSLIRKPAFMVSDAAKIVDVLREMQARRSHLAIVKDEFGATSGVITLEDILEEIVGEIQDEYDDDEDVARISEVTPGQYNVDGAMLVDDLETELDATLREGTSSDTIGGLMVELAGRVPVVGDVVQVGDFELTVKEVDGRRVSLLQLTPRTTPEEQGATG